MVTSRIAEPVTKDRLQQQYYSGRTVDELAHEYNLTAWKVRDMLRQAGTTMRRRGPRTPRTDKWAQRS